MVNVIRVNDLNVFLFLCFVILKYLIHLQNRNREDLRDYEGNPALPWLRLLVPSLNYLIFKSNTFNYFRFNHVSIRGMGTFSCVNHH